MTEPWAEQTEYEKARRCIRRRDWFANNVPVIGPLAFRFWLWRSRRG